MMKKIYKILILICIIAVVSATSSYAATTYAISASKIGYTDNQSLGATDVQAAIDGTCTKFSSQLTNLKENIIDTIYPVGSIYTSETDSTIDSVESRFKTFGKDTKWEKYGQGKTLVGDGTGTDSNGTNQTFSVSNNSKNLGEYSHSHMTPLFKGGMGSSTDDNAIYTNWNGSNWGYSKLTTIMSGKANAKFSVIGTAESKSGYSLLTSSSSNLEPYITVYMYKRIK